MDLMHSPLGPTTFEEDNAESGPASLPITTTN